MHLLIKESVGKNRVEAHGEAWKRLALKYPEGGLKRMYTCPIAPVCSPRETNTISYGYTRYRN
jgi:hypothetical protein